MTIINMKGGVTAKTVEMTAAIVISRKMLFSRMTWPKSQPRPKGRSSSVRAWRRFSRIVSPAHCSLREQWAGETILLKRRHALTDEERPFGLGWLFGQVIREKSIFRDITIAAVISTVFAVTPPFMFMIVIDRVLVHHSTSTLAVIA